MARQGTVYIVASRERLSVKVHHTTDFAASVKELEKVMDDKLEIVFAFPGSHTMACKLIEEIDYERRYKGWFDLTTEIIKVLQRYASDSLVDLQLALHYGSYQEQ